jgi:poly(hydroxyalkanoate) depolymerase family esterase
MKIDFAEAMLLATRATRANDVAQATKILRRALTGRVGTGEDDAGFASGPAPLSKMLSALPSIDRDSLRFELDRETRRPSGVADAQPPRARRPLGEVLTALRGGRLASSAFAPSRARKPSGPPSIPEGAQFLTSSFTCAAGARDYKLYIPASAPVAPRGLVVMLHGCQQDPNDFAVGTNMNAVAESRGLLIAYPGQARVSNPSSCWNWFDPAHQNRDAGEPSIIAGLTRDIASRFGLERRHVFVAGLSAGGAMAAVMAETYPEIYAAVGVHSGLAYRSATDMASAFAAMRGPVRMSAAEAPTAASGVGRSVRAIVFHGTQDRTVHPANADRVVEAARSRLAPGHGRLERDGVAGDRRCTNTMFLDPDGVPVVEVWRIDGAGHAWSGGNASGSFTDSEGPDASAEMVRFFLAPDSDRRKGHAEI